MSRTRAIGPIGTIARVAAGFGLIVLAIKLDGVGWDYAGCESLAIPNWLLRRDDQVGCIVFWPLDAVEARVTEQPNV